jgi:hypothetical protein
MLHQKKNHLFHAALLASALGMAVATTAQARVTKIIIDETTPMAVEQGQTAPAIAYETIAGRAFGELDPTLPHNALIQDIELAKDKDGKVRYVASFVIHKPVELKNASGMLWHDVPNRGRVYPFSPREQALGDILLASAWQGDNSGNTRVRPVNSAKTGQFLEVPVARQLNGDPVTGEVFGRIVNRSGKSSQPLIVQSNPLPYKPVSLDTSKAKLTSRAGEGMHGVGGAVVVDHGAQREDSHRHRLQLIITAMASNGEGSGTRQG